MWKMTLSTLLFVTICLVQYVTPQIVVNLQVKNLLRMQQGLGVPHILRVAKGNEALLRLDRTLENYRSCEITTPSGKTFNVKSPQNNRYSEWSDGCGVRIRNIAVTDEGRWRLTAISANNSITGWTELYVEELKASYTGSPISLKDGETKAKIELTTLENSYCFVSKPFAESSLVPGHCSVILDRTTRAIQGNWNILLGLPGQVTELETKRRVTVETERLDVGYINDRSENKLHLYCNILHTTKNITFCRFQKTSESFGYNVVDGLSDGQHSYYGKGFAMKQCGLTLENPKSSDYGTWRCSVGVQSWVGSNIKSQTPMQALISVAPNTRSRPHRDLINGRGQTIFVQQNKTFTVMCRAKISLAYCWFQHPNGTQFTPGPLVDEQQLFWYTGQSLQLGDCGITFSYVTLEDAGNWICHMGPRDQCGEELTDNVLVKVTGPLASNKREIETSVGGVATLHCHTSNGNKPLEYCRFLSPNFIGIRIDETVTENSKILDRFYFTPNRSLVYGDCSLTINPVIDKDVGEWTCAALIHDEPLEARDYVTVYIVDAAAPLSTASIVGMSFGLFVLVLALAAVLYYKNRRRLLPWRTSPTSTTGDNFSMNTRTSNAESATSDET
ncbi:uncharacterized protein [Battus philenor]|uniref:uncharacterized protein n=1 Tax=Battus philenor TaxID=42288 RepID=UPI0035CF90C0